MRIITIVFFSLFVGGIITPLSAQFTFLGTIKNAKTKVALDGVTVQLLSHKVEEITDDNGYFDIKLPAIASDTARLVVVIQHLGFEPLREIIPITRSDNNDLVLREYELKPEAVELEDVIVTANRVEENLQDVPTAVTSINAKELENRSIVNTVEALESVPNLITDAYLPSQPTFSLRGLASNFDNNGIENSVGLYINDVFYSRSFSFNSTLMDIDRIEVLRGPQGTLFGKNTVGGVLHIITEKPKMGNFGALELSTGNYNLLQARGKANVMLVKDKLALRVAGALRKRDGWMLEENPELQDVNGTLFYGGRASLLFQPKDDFKINITAHVGQDDRAEFTTDFQPASFDRRLDYDEADPLDRRSSRNELDESFNRTVVGLNGKVEWALDSVHTLTSVTGYNYSKTESFRDFDVTPIPAAIFAKNTDLNTFSQEIRISTPRENRKLFYVGGLYYLQESIAARDSIALQEDFAPVWQRQFGLPVSPIPGYFEYVSPNSQVESTSMAAYLSGSLEVSERVRVNAGLRYTNEKKTLDFFQNVGSDFGLIELAVSQVGSAEQPLEREVIDKVWSYNIGMDFKTTEKMLIYANYSRGFKGAGFNTEFAPDSLGGTLVFRPEFINNYEFGIKYQFSDTYRVNTSAFITDYKDKQETAPGGSAYRVANAESAEGLGLESELTAKYSSGFQMATSFGYLYLRYLSFPFSDRNGQPINLTGNRLYKAPEFTFRAAPAYSLYLNSEISLFMQAEYNYVSKAFNDIYNTEALARQGAGIVNARLAFSIQQERYTIALWGKNLTDATFFQHAWEFNFGSHVALNPPRTLGVEFRVNFY
ncbi:MAG: TonB-dependent receptor [Saprospiraceae bacterium]